MRIPLRHALLACVGALTVIGGNGCISAPDVVMLDRKTVLEEQASGELHALENELREEAIVPKGEDFTRTEIQASGADLSQDALGSIVAIHRSLQTEADFLGDLLIRRCIGEGRTGLLVETPRRCAGRTRAARISAAVDRVNRARRQLWHYLQAQRPEASEAEVRGTWRKHHLEAMVCGGQYQDEAGAWEIKRC